MTGLDDMYSESIQIYRDYDAAIWNMTGCSYEHVRERIQERSERHH